MVVVAARGAGAGANANECCWLPDATRAADAVNLASWHWEMGSSWMILLGSLGMGGASDRGGVFPMLASVVARSVGEAVASGAALRCDSAGTAANNFDALASTFLAPSEMSDDSCTSAMASSISLREILPYVAVSLIAGRGSCCSETIMADSDTALLDDETAEEAFNDDDDDDDDDDDEKDGNGGEEAVDEDSGERSTSILFATGGGGAGGGGVRSSWPFISVQYWKK